MLSDAKKRANRKYNEKAYEQLAIRLPKGERDKIKEKAARCNMSLASFVRAACEAYEP